MAETLALGASAISFVAFAGQILQGCWSLHAFLDNMKEAQADVQSFKRELTIFQTTLDTLRSRIITEDRVNDDVRLALEYSDETITEFQNVITKLQKKSKSRFVNIRTALRKDSMMKHVGRLQRATSLIIAAQLNLAISMGQKDVQESRSVVQALISLIEATRAPAIIPPYVMPGSWHTVVLGDGPARDALETQESDSPNELRRFQDVLGEALSLPASNPSPLEPPGSGRLESESQSTLSDPTLMETLGNESRDPLLDAAGLTIDMLEMVKDTIRGVLVEYHHDEDGVTSDLGAITDAWHPTSRPDQRSKRPKYGKVLVPGKAIRQISRQKSYQRSIGLVTVQTTTTAILDSIAGSKEEQMLVSSRSRTQVKIDPNPAFVRVGIYVTAISSSLPEYQPGFDPVIRTYNLVGVDAPIISACRAGDLGAVCTLFATHQASLFDRPVTAQGLSLLDIVFKQIIYIMGQPTGAVQSMSDLSRLFTHLVNQGLDPGQLCCQQRLSRRGDRLILPPSTQSGVICHYCFLEIDTDYYQCDFCAKGDFILCQACWSSESGCPQHHTGQQLHMSEELPRVVRRSALESLASLNYTAEFATDLTRVARTIIQQSIQDPFEDTTLGEMLWYKDIVGMESPVCPVILNQEEWLLEGRDVPEPPEERPDIGARNFLFRDKKASALRAWLNSPQFQTKKQKLDAVSRSLGHLKFSERGSDLEESIINHVLVGLDIEQSYVDGEICSKDSEILPALFIVFRKHSRLPLLHQVANRYDSASDGKRNHRSLLEDLIERDLYMSMTFQLAFLDIKGYFPPGEIQFREILEWEWQSYAKYHAAARSASICDWYQVAEPEPKLPLEIKLAVVYLAAFLIGAFVFGSIYEALRLLQEIQRQSDRDASCHGCLIY